jgi:hypothetical protein
MHAPFRITGHVFTALDCVVVEIADGGAIGRGEAAGVYYLADTPDMAFDQILAIKSELEHGLDRQALQMLLPPGGARKRGGLRVVGFGMQAQRPIHLGQSRRQRSHAYNLSNHRRA